MKTIKPCEKPLCSLGPDGAAEGSCSFMSAAVVGELNEDPANPETFDQLVAFNHFQSLGIEAVTVHHQSLFLNMFGKMFKCPLLS